MMFLKSMVMLKIRIIEQDYNSKLLFFRKLCKIIFEP